MREKTRQTIGDAIGTVFAAVSMVALYLACLYVAVRVIVIALRHAGVAL